MAKIMTIRPPEELHNILKRTAKKSGYTMNALVLHILWDWLEKEEKSASKKD